MAIYGDWVLSLFGPEFAHGYSTLLVLCVAWLLVGLFGNSGLVLAGAGYSRLALANAVYAIVIEAIALRWLIPQIGILGAALAVLVQWLFELLEKLVVPGSLRAVMEN